MRIVFVTVDDVFYLPRFFSRVLPEWADETAAVVVLAPARSSKVTARRAYTLYGPWGVLWNSSRYVFRTFGSRLGPWVPRWRDLSVAGIAGRHHIPVYRPQSVNHPDFVAHLRHDVKPDLVVSVAAPEIFRDTLLCLPPMGCINVHGAMLPRYRGMLPSFWTLLHGESEGGVTVHYMSAGIDDGAIIAQRKFPIVHGDTVDSLIRRSKTVGAELLCDVLQKLKDGRITTFPNNSREGTYHSFPTRQDVRRLKALGRRVM